MVKWDFESFLSRRFNHISAFFGTFSAHFGAYFTMIHVDVFFTFFGASIANFGALLVKRTNPFVARTQHIGSSEADDCALMVELNAPNAQRYFGGMQTFVGAMVAGYCAGEAGFNTFFKIVITHFIKIKK